MRLRCPRCDEPFEDDGDRRYDDECFNCGWKSKERELSDKLNTAKFSFERLVDQLAETIYTYQQHYNEDCGIPYGPEWKMALEHARVPYYQKARSALNSHESYWRGQLHAYREAKRAPKIENNPLYEPGEISDEWIEQVAEDHYRKAHEDDAAWVAWWDTTRSVRDYYRQTATREIKNRLHERAMRDIPADQVEEEARMTYGREISGTEYVDWPTTPEQVRDEYRHKAREAIVARRARQAARAAEGGL